MMLCRRPVVRPSRARGLLIGSFAGLMLAFGISPSSAQCPNSPLFSFNTNGSNGWTVGGGATTVLSPDTPGAARWTINPSADPQIKSPIISCAAASFKFFRIGSNNHGLNTSGRLYYDNGTGFAESRSVGFTNPSKPSRDSWISVKVGGAPGWSGTIRQIRVDPVTSGSGDPDNVDMNYVFWRNDTRAPEFRTTTARPDPIEVAPAGWTSGDITVTIRGKDLPQVASVGPDVYGSGCVGFNISLDGGPAVFRANSSFDDFNGDAGLVLTYAAGTLSSGPHIIAVQPVDLVGLVGTSQSRSLLFDAAPPGVPTITSVTPSGFSTTNSFTIAWNNPGDAGSGINRYQYVVDSIDGPYDVAGNSVIIGAPNVGTHTIQVQAIDNIGLPSGYSATADFSFDNAPPAAPANVNASPSGLTNLNSFTMTWPLVVDDGSGTQGYEWKVDEGPVGFTTLLSVSGALAPSPGTHTFSVRARDNVNLVSAIWRTTTFTWDPNYLPPPEVNAPADGVTIGLPEVFSWTARAGATGYVLQIAPGGNFNGPTWTTQTSLTSLTVPRDAAVQTGNYGWRLRAIGPSAPVIWGPTRGFTRVTSAAPPTAPPLLFPPDASTQNSGDVTFQWGSAANATAYRLEIATDPAFPAGGAAGVVNEGLVGTLYTLHLDAPATTFYWRVTARNSAGYGTPSPTGSFTLAALPPSVAGVLITAPATDLSAEQGASIQATGLIVGRYSGTVNVEWLLDDNVFSSSTVTLDGSGLDIDPVSVPSSEVGVHQLVLRVTTDVTTTSPTRIIQITSPGVGPADHLVVVADQPQILANMTTTLFCTVRDAEGSLVLSDSGRTVQFDPDSDAGTIAPLTATTTAGLALSTYTAAAADVELTVTATSVDAGPFTHRSATAALKSDKVKVGSSTSTLALEKKIAFEYLARLSRLPMDGIEGAFPGAPVLTAWPTLSVGNAWSFVNSARAGDEARLHRLNIFLRYLDRAYFYDPRVNKLGIAESGPIPGVASMQFDLANAMGKLALSVFEVMGKTPPAGKGKWWMKLYQPILDMLNRQLLVTFDKLGQSVITLGCRNPVLKNDLLGVWSQALSVSDKYTSDHPALGIVGLWAQGSVTNTIAATAMRSRYVRPMQWQLDFVVDRLRQSSWNGGSHTPSEQAVATALQQIRARTDYQHRWFRAASDALDGNVVAALESSASIVAGLGAGYMQAFQKILFLIVKNAILLASGVDCWSTASAISLQQAPVIAGYIVGNGGAAPSRAALYSETGLQWPAQPKSAFAPLSPSALSAASVDMTSSLASYELIIHDLEQRLLASDTLGTQLVMTQIADAERDLQDAERSAGGPLLATFEDARVTVEDHASQLDSMNALFDEASLSRSRGTAAVTDWLADASDLSLRDLALAQARGALDTTRTTFAKAGASLSLALGRAAVPYISLASPRTPSLAVYSDSIDVQVTATNLGGGTAGSVRLRFVDSPDIELLSPELYELGSLEPGQSASAHWKVRFYPSVTDSTTPVSVTFNVVVDSTDAGIGSSRAGSIPVYPPQALTGVSGGSHGARLWLTADPNPSRGTVRLGVTAADAGAGSIEIIDVTGRRVAVVATWPQGHAPLQASWAGTLTNGHRAGPGIYFARLRTARGTRVTRIVRIQ